MNKLNPIAVSAALLWVLLGPRAAGAQFPYPPQMEGARVETYKTVGSTKLELYLFQPSVTNQRPAIVFFFGGGWSSGSPQQFERQCRYLAARGMVAITADYRVATRQQAKPVQCVADARSAIRWLRANASRLGIDPQRIAAGGGSAGGHIAACATFTDEFDEPGEDKNISASPNALVLFNPALVLAPLGDLKLEGFGVRMPEERLGAPAVRLSPAHQIKTGGPPTIIFHGRNDSTVPYVTAEAFAARMKAAGNRCELSGFDGQAHGFFNREPWLTQTLKATDQFLTSLGWLSNERPSHQP